MVAVLGVLSEGVYGTLSEKGLKRACEAQLSIEFVIQLVNSILELEQFGSGKQPLLLGPTDIGKIVDLAMQSVVSLADKRSLTLVRLGISAPLVADETRLVQVVINFLGNAIKYSPTSAQIEICTALVDDKFVEVKVTDSGRGVPEAHRQKVFERFHQVERADATERGGIGLGLAICKEIVELHGGSIGIEGNDNQGSTYWFRVPTNA